jgi:uncharacterized protein CbrC (UPF0167 family)
MTNATTFRYFADPHNFSTYQPSPRECDLCHQVRPGYADAFYTDESGPDIRFVCEEDLAAGRLADVGAQVNNGDRFELYEQLSAAHPEWAEPQLDAHISALNLALEVATPSITTWSDYAWPVHCADYMRYIKEIGRADCDRLGSGGDGRAFLQTAIDPSYKEGSSPDEVREYLSELWDRMRPDAPSDNTAITEASFYLFQCLECGDYLIEWDEDEVTGAAPPDAYSEDVG